MGTVQRSAKLKDDVLDIGRHLELDVRKPMRKLSLVRTIVEHIVDNNIFEEETLSQFLINEQCLRHKSN